MSKEASAARTVVALQIARTLRSVTQGIGVVDLALYLKELHWSAAAIGGVFSAAGVVGALLIILVGLLGDRVGRKPFLLAYEIATTVAALAISVSANPVLLAIVIIITGFGRGQNGAAGPFSPAEQAWMASCVPGRERGRVFSINNALGFFGMAAGAILGGATVLWRHALPGALAFRPLFFLIFLLSAACVFVISRARETRDAAVAHATTEAGNTAPEVVAEQAVRREENRDMARLFAVNLLNGLAIGFMGPMMSYWFAVRFGASAATVGITLASAFALTGVSSLLTGAATKRYGMVRSVVLLQVIGVALIVLLPLMPTLWLASGVYIVRSAVSRGTQGARSALSSSLTRDTRRGFSISMNAFSMRAASSVGPTVAGYLMDSGALSAPFYVASVLQLASALLYGNLFKRYDRHIPN